MNFFKGDSGVDQIADSGGKDKLLLTNYSQFGTSARTLSRTAKPTALAFTWAPRASPLRTV
jgi:hypothetical protein